MRSFDHFDLFLGTDSLQQSPCTTIGIGNKNLIHTIFTERTNFVAHSLRNFFGRVMQNRGQTGQHDVIHLIGFHDCQYFMRDRAAADNRNATPRGRIQTV